MSFGDLLGQIMQQGLGAGSPTRDRIETSARNLDQPAGGLGGIFEQLQGALGGAGGSAGGFADRAQDFLRQDQVGGLSGAQVGGIGALAGAVLGGGLSGAAKGGAMAVLGTLALQAIQRARANAGEASAEPKLDPTEVKSLVGPESERLALQAMISAASGAGPSELPSR